MFLKTEKGKEEAWENVYTSDNIFVGYKSKLL